MADRTTGELQLFGFFCAMDQPRAKKAFWRAKRKALFAAPN